MDKAEKQYQMVNEALPDASFIKNTNYHVRIPVKNEIFLDINFKRYPKIPEVKLIKSDGKTFGLNKVIASLRDWYKTTPPSILELTEEIQSLIKCLELNQIKVNKDLLNGLMEICKNRHPVKLVGLLSVKKGIVSEYILPSRACTDVIKNVEVWGGRSCSIPFSLSHEGTFISRPSGKLSTNEKLNKVFKKRRFTMLLSHPYNNLKCVKCFDSYGKILELIVVD